MFSRLIVAFVLIFGCCTVGTAQGGAVANFIGTDTTTQGSWQGVYGADGYSIEGASQSIPTYASFAVQNELNFTWNPSTTDPRALQLPGGAGRYASTWFTNDHLASPVFDFDVNFTDANTHQFALYALDWDATGRVETIQVLDANTNAVLDTRTISNFTNGMYLVWNISGHVEITVSLAGGTNGVISGAFFGGSNSTGVSVSPQSVSLNGGQTQPFTATQQSAPNATFTWSISPNVGSIGATTGVYVAPTSVAPQTITVTATNATDGTKFGTAAVNLTTAAIANFAGTDSSTGGTWQGTYGADGYSIADSNQSVPAYASFGAQNLLGYTWVASTSDLRALQDGVGGRIAATWFSSHFSLPQIITFDINLTDANTHQVAFYALDWDSGGRSETFTVLDATTSAVLDTRTLSNFQGGVYMIWKFSGHVKINVTLNAGPNGVVSGVFFGGSTSGGGGGGGGTPISVKVTPATITLGANQPQPFTATVTGTANQTVSWSINPSVGSIDSVSGKYTSPATISSAQQITVKALSSADGTTFGTATVNLSPGAAVANFVLSDTTTQGNWVGVYGGDGNSIAAQTPSIPGYASFASQNASAFTWNSNTSDPRALAVGGGRIASTWYGASYSYTVNFSDGQAHQLALYALDWDNGGRGETVQIFDAGTNALLDTRNLSGFSNGTYLVWNITGNVKITVTLTSGANAVISGVFFGGGGAVGVTVSPSIVSLSAGQQQQFSSTVSAVNWSLTGAGSITTGGLYKAPSPITVAGSATVTATSQADASKFGTATVNLSPGASANFVSTDTVTQGSWNGKYGIEGYSIANDSQSIPAYATFAVQNQSNYTWNGSTSDPRALVKGGGGGRIASCWYYISNFNFDVNFTDGGTHQIEIYALDWDATGRSEQIQIVDAASNAVLDTRSISSFSNGVYLIWNISGHVKINVSLTGGPNPVLSGVFFK